MPQTAWGTYPTLSKDGRNPDYEVKKWAEKVPNFLKWTEMLKKKKGCKLLPGVLQIIQLSQNHWLGIVTVCQVYRFNPTAGSPMSSQSNCKGYSRIKTRKLIWDFEGEFHLKVLKKKNKKPYMKYTFRTPREFIKHAKCWYHIWKQHTHFITELQEMCFIIHHLEPADSSHFLYTQKNSNVNHIMNNLFEL